MKSRKAIAFFLCIIFVCSRSFANWSVQVNHPHIKVIAVQNNVLSVFYSLSHEDFCKLYQCRIDEVYPSEIIPEDEEDHSYINHFDLQLYHAHLAFENRIDPSFFVNLLNFFDFTPEENERIASLYNQYALNASSLDSRVYRARNSGEAFLLQELSQILSEFVLEANVADGTIFFINAQVTAGRLLLTTLPQDNLNPATAQTAATPSSSSTSSTSDLLQEPALLQKLSQVLTRIDMEADVENSTSFNIKVHFTEGNLLLMTLPHGNLNATTTQTAAIPPTSSTSSTSEVDSSTDTDNNRPTIAPSSLNQGNPNQTSWDSGTSSVSSTGGTSFPVYGRSDT